MLIFKLAFRNLLGAGLRTWLNVAVLSFAFLVIIFYNGLIDGWNQQARKDTIEWQYGQGQLWHEAYDPFDPFTLQDAHSTLDPSVASSLTPILSRQATIYPEGRMLPVLLQGIPTDQQTLKLPTTQLDTAVNAIPAMIGKRMAKEFRLKKGDRLLTRWRDKNGTFDAKDMVIVHVFDNNVPTIDNGQVWIPIEHLWAMTGLDNEATLWVSPTSDPIGAEGWLYKGHDKLLATLDFMIQSEKASNSIIYIMLLCIALLAVFDTQVLSVFRRQREIGTYIALGMTRWQVAGLFTVEGATNSILAIIAGAIYGIPILGYTVKIGIGMPESSTSMGVSLADRIYPVYSIGLITVTIVILFVTTTIVSFMPARKIARMNPIDALKGKLQ